MSGLADLAHASASGGSLSASIASPDLDPATAITAGEGLFNNAYQAGGGSMTGTVAMAASAVAMLPSGAAKNLLSSLAGIAAGAAAGAAMGSVIPGWGTAVGAAVGALMGMFEAFGSSSPAPLQGDVRSTAERYCFPAVQASPGGSDPQSMMQQSSAQPASWPDIRIHSVGYQVAFSGTDPATGQNEPDAFNFGVSWVSPPGSTPASKQAAWYIAQAWLGSNSVSRRWALKETPPGGDAAMLAGMSKAALQRAWTALGSPSAVTAALKLLGGWYGTRFSLNFRPNDRNKNTPCAGVEGDFGVTPPASFYSGKLSDVNAYLLDFANMARCLNGQDALDFSYYFSLNTWLAAQTSGTSHWHEQTPIVPNPLVNAYRFAALPDTTLVGLAELACLVATGVIPKAGADHIALQYVLGLAWLWRQGQETDAAIPPGVNDAQPLVKYPNENHPNFSRILGVISHKINPHHTHAALANTKPKPVKVALSHAASVPVAPPRALQPTRPAASTVGQDIGTIARSELGEVVGAVLLAAGAAGAVWWKRTRRR